MWLWIGIGLGGCFALSVLLGLALAAMLGTISHGVSELHDELFDARPWAVEPPTPRRRRSRLRRRAPALLELHP